jgi:predicted nucleic acid-binding protein
MRIYIESTIPSYVVARPARDLLQAARQQLTKDWWDLKREKHELFTSQVVLDEIAFGEKAMAQLRLELLQGVPLLPVTDDVKDFARKVQTSGLLPATADRDATHIALASAYEMDILLSWNCRHIANAMIQARLRRLADDAGFTLPVLCTPEELLENDNEQND